ncbi:MAG: ribonuclease Y [Christensenellaceae bacterium]|nr:ribonuclease Y [Christensenellaceae bacterium]
MLGGLQGVTLGLGIPLALVIGFLAGYFVKVLLERKSGERSRQSASKIIEKALAEAATHKKEALLEAKEDAHKQKTQLEQELRERRAEMQRSESRVAMREEQLSKREETITNRELGIESTRSAIENTKKQVEKNLVEAKAKLQDAVGKLEKITGLTKAQAKKEIIDSLVDEAKGEAVELVKRIADEAKEDADKKAREVITAAVQRVAADHSSEITVSTVAIPNDDIKGRLIGREGRNIRALEAATGVDLIIDDTPESITVSGFDPYRREIARMAIEKLVQDGRIHPARIEEIVAHTKKDIDIIIKEAGDQAAYDCKVHGLHPELVKQLGRLKYRTSYGQNVLNHCREVSYIAGLLAVELGANEQIAKRGGLLHDIGKATDHESDGTHVSIGVDLAKKCKESAEVIHCIEAHHGDVPYKSIEAIIVQVADAISSARPGARRENVEGYIKRLKDLEAIADSKPGVDKAYAISAGREVRVIVRPNEVSDEKALFLAKEIAKEIEEKMTYPGQVKVSVIRESRATEIAK